MEFKSIFTPLKIGNMVLKNRLVIPGMGNNLGSEDGAGDMTPKAQAYYAERAKGGYGLIMTEVVRVTEDGNSIPQEISIYDDKFIPGLRKIVEEVHQYGSKICAQLHHAGREAERSQKAPSPIKMSSSPFFKSVAPKELTTQECWELIHAFSDAAVRAKKAGFDCVELHGGHQYLIAQFLSPYTNKRTDEFGGNTDNRARFLTEIIKEIKEKCGDYPVIVRISGDERAYGGRTPLQSAVLARIIEAAGADALNISVGNGATNATVAPPSYPMGHILDDASRVKKAVSIPVIGVGRVHDPYMIDAAIDEGWVDAVAVGRQSIADPYFPNKLLAGHPEEVCPCVSCLQGCVGRLNDPDYLDINCLMNPFVSREHEWKIEEAGQKKKIVVIGAGAAGMQYAQIAAQRGHEVIIFEKNDRVGGQVLLAAMPPSKQAFCSAIRYWETMCRKYDVEIRLNTTATVELINAENPDVVVIATGSLSAHPPFKGLEEHAVMDAREVLIGKVTPEHKSMVIGGGLVGCELASMLAEQGHEITIVEMGDHLLPELALWQQWAQQDLLEFVTEKCKIQTSSKVMEVLKDGVVLECNGEQLTLDGYGSVILACGAKPLNVFSDKLGDIPEVQVIGDAVKVSKIIDAVEEATRYALYV